MQLQKIQTEILIRLVWEDTTTNSTDVQGRECSGAKYSLYEAMEDANYEKREFSMEMTHNGNKMDNIS
jgi:hypothetical protein